MIKKKILMVGPFPPTIGGITSCMLNIIKSNLNKEYEFIPFTTTRPTIGLFKDVIDYTLIFKIGFINLLKCVIITFQNIIKFPIILIAKKPEIIHIHTTDYFNFWESSIYVLFSNFFLKKIILHIHATSFPVFYKTESSYIKKIIRKILNISNIVIVLSRKQKTFFMDLVSEDKLKSIPNAVNIKKIISKSRYKLIDSNIIKIIFIGGEEAKRKGIYDILKAIPYVVEKYGEEILFIFVGRCNTVDIKNICEEKNLNKYVKFYGYVKENEKIEILSSSDIFILPSYAEGLPISILEAMSVGLPIISTIVGSIPEVIKNDRNGYLIIPGDYTSLADKIIYLSLNKNIRKTMGRNNIKKVIKNYDIKTYEDILNKLYKKCSSEIHARGNNT